MTTLVIVSLCVLVFQIILKHVEIKWQKNHFLAGWFKKGDAKLHAFREQAIFAYNRYKKIARIFIFDFVPAYAYEQLTKLKDYVAKKYYESADHFRGRRVLRSNGSVSFFLEKLAEKEPQISNREII